MATKKECEKIVDTVLDWVLGKADALPNIPVIDEKAIADSGIEEHRDEVKKAVCEKYASDKEKKKDKDKDKKKDKEKDKKDKKKDKKNKE